MVGGFSECFSEGFSDGISDGICNSKVSDASVKMIVVKVYRN